MSPPTTAEPRPTRGVPVEIINMGGTALALLVVVAVGGWLNSIAPPGVWFTAMSYGVPVAIAFAAYCLVARRVRPDR